MPTNQLREENLTFFRLVSLHVKESINFQNKGLNELENVWCNVMINDGWHSKYAHY